ncbi:hypothetical protein T484DRAFT_1756371 [Baffinella frigidus]|nr:hypothetical protein T484DRAFT_1756371 [Cryptophyta sp. CCMP2293]
MQRSNTIYNKQVANVRSGALYKTWCRLRGPFIVPDDVTNHSCEGQWEKFDVDKAACRTCSRVHLCHILKCETLCESDGMVCLITGLCLGQRMLAQYETPCDPVREQDPHTHTENSSKIVTESPTEQYLFLRKICPLKHSPSVNECVLKHQNTDAIMRTISNILLSNTTQKSIDNENLKMNSRLRSICVRRLRLYHTTRQIPNICDLEAHLHFNIHGHRVPPPAVEQSHAERLQCAERATASIAQLLQFMRTYCGNVPTCVKHGGVVIGMLYMMRTGVTIDDITVLPRITALKRLLPMEQHLLTFFDIRPKIVTEAENVVKYNMRNIPAHNLALLAQTQCIMRTT